MNKIIPIILAGGTGSRLWPLSRESFPKQFLELINEDKNTLLQTTYKRIENLGNITRPIIICNEEHRFIVGDQMRQINIEPLAIILEPARRNTAPAITVAALKALQIFREEDTDPILLILSSDHYIKEVSKFTQSIKYSIDKAKDGELFIFGVVPRFPATGYGYIKSVIELEEGKLDALKVEKFIEKPNKEKAKSLFENKKYSWNSGMFVFRANSIIKEIEEFAPNILRYCKESLTKSKKDLDFVRLDKENFSKCDDISIDIAIFEKTNKAFVVPLDCGWDDIGSWDSLWNISKKDSNGNSIKGNVFSQDTKNSLIRGGEKLLVTLGLKDLLILDTQDALLIANKKDAQEVKNIVLSLNKKQFKEGKEHQRMYRPWGNYLSIQKEENNWQIKKIEVNPGASLSLQLHNHRSEHWIVLQGTAEIEINNKREILSKNQSTYIPIGAKHRLSNPGKIKLILIEVQCGSYLGEDDIIRFVDNYGRVVNI